MQPAGEYRQELYCKRQCLSRGLYGWRFKGWLAL